MHTPKLGGNWVSIKSAVFLDYDNDAEGKSSCSALSLTKKKLLESLLQEHLNIVTISSSIVKCMKDEACKGNGVSPHFVRHQTPSSIAWFASITSGAGDLGCIVDLEDPATSYIVVREEETYLPETVLCMDSRYATERL
eukprot:scaffold724_cov264-Chaetoceros_neogracile.AAC.3